MATTSTTGQSKYVEFDEFIDFQLQKTRAGIKANDIVTALAGVATLCLAYILIFVVFDHWIVDGGFSPVGRWLMLGGLIVACAVWIVWRVVLPARRQVTGLFAARAIETTQPQLQHALLNLVDLRRSGKQVPEEISRAMEKRAAVTLTKTDVDSAVDRRPLMRLSYALAALVLLSCLYALFSPKSISASIWRALFPASATAVDTAIKIDKVAVEYQGRLHDPDVTVVARSKLEVIVDLSYAGAAPDEVTLFYSTADEKYRDVPVPMRPDAKEPKRYRIPLTGESNRGILQNTTYRIKAGDAKAGPFRITVIRPPIASVKQVRYVYPKYMEREPKTQDGGHIETWEGTAVTVTAKTDQPVTDAWLVFTDTEDIAKPVAKVRMTIEKGTALSVNLKREIAFREDGSYPRFYHIECVGKAGFKDPRPALYGVTIRRDLPPEIVLLDPQGTERDVPANTPILPLLYKARDPDFKLRMVTLRAELTRGGKGDDKPEEFDEQVFDGLKDGLKKEIQAGYDWKLERMRLKAGDTVRFRLEARDNKQPAGNRTFTPWFTLRIVEPVSKDKAQQQLQADRDRQKQMQQEQENNQGDQNPDNQQDNQPPKKSDKKADPKNDDGKKKDKGKVGAKKNGGNEGQPKAGKNGKSKAGNNQEPDGGQEGNSNKSDPKGRKDGMGQGEPKPDEQLIRDALRDQQRKQQAKSGQPKGKNETQQPDESNPGIAKKDPQNGTDPDGGQSPKKQPDGNSGKKETAKKETAKKETAKKETGKKDGGQGHAPMPKLDQKVPGKKSDTASPKPDGPQKKSASDGMGTSGSKTDAKKDGAKQKSNGTTGAPPPKKDPGMTDDGSAGTTGKSNAKKTDPKKKSNDSAAGDPKKKSANNDDGPRKTVDNDPSAREKKASGNETGKAQPNNDSKAKPTRSKKPDEIKRAKGTEPATKKSTGDPKDPGMQNGSSNPKTAKSKTAKKDIPSNPDERPTPPKDPGKKVAKQSNDQKDPGNKKLQGTESKAKSKKSDGGEDGMGTASDQGRKGSQQKGSGDTTKKMGSQQDSGREKTGQSGKKSGMGSTSKSGSSKPGGKKEAGNNSQSGDPSKADPAGGQLGKKPGTSGNAPNIPKRNANARDVGGAGNGIGKKGANPPPDDPDPDKADLNHGRNASNLVLKDLEDKLKRGDVDKEWLKKHGWKSREDGLKQIDRIKKRNESPDPQFAEFLKSIRDLKFQSEAGKRDGSKVRKTVIPGEGNTGSENVPPHLRSYYKAFRQSVNKK